MAVFTSGDGLKSVHREKSATHEKREVMRERSRKTRITAGSCSAEILHRRWRPANRNKRAFAERRAPQIKSRATKVPRGCLGKARKSISDMCQCCGKRL